MASLVCKNPEIRVGSLVFCNSYRNPALHAKMGATLDILSQGRFDFGIGAGWKKMEYRAYGYEFPSDHERIDQLVEALQIIRGAWTQERFTFHGDHYHVEDLISSPKPVRIPHPPIIVGTMYGRPRMVEVAAKHADGINLAWAFDAKTASSIFEIIDEIRKKEGLDESFRRTLGYWTRTFSSDDEMEEAISTRAKKRGIAVEESQKQVSSALWGTPERLREKALAFREMDVSDLVLMFPHRDECSQIEMLGPTLLDLR
jgi:alkanesulfonate monooxygenase SsuD/methylene tetrahydromethanopterin reductase-like flavin-dependent oxidoreductase (luciferase family)